MDVKDIARAIRQEMLKRDLTQNKIAEQAGFTKQQFSDMLNGRKVIRAEYMQPIADALGVSVGELYAAGAADGTA